MTDELCPCDLVALDAFDLLTDAERHAMQSYLAECPELEAELTDFRRAVATIPYSAPSASLSASLKDRLFERINSERFDQELESATSQDTSLAGLLKYPAAVVDSSLNHVKKAFQVANVLLRQLTSGDRLAVRSQDIAWQPYRVPGVMVAILHIDLVKREATALLRAEPGVQYPLHRHGMDEEIYMLEGDLIIDGVMYTAGDYIRSKPSSTHAPLTVGGCMSFVRTSLHDEYFANLALQK